MNTYFMLILHVDCDFQSGLLLLWKDFSLWDVENGRNRLRTRVMQALEHRINLRD